MQINILDTPPVPQGKFITIEGGEGVGKGTLIENLKPLLHNREVVYTREPGGSAGADQIRKLLVEGDALRWTSITEALLFVAARCDHLEKTIYPALYKGYHVICDRYIDSTYAYQVAAGRISEEVFNNLHSAINYRKPDLTLILDLPPKIGLERSRSTSKGEGRFESKPLEYHQAVRMSFAQIAMKDVNRCRLIDASGTPEEVAAEAMKYINEFFNRHRGSVTSFQGTN
jgi:dTMP kinase